MQNSPPKSCFYYIFCCFCCRKPGINPLNPSSPSQNLNKIEILTHKTHIKLEVLLKNPQNSTKSHNFIDFRSLASSLRPQKSRNSLIYVRFASNITIVIEFLEKNS